MSKTTIISLLTILLLFAPGASPYSQNQYCYHPTDKNNVIQKGAFSFYVSSFVPTDVSQTEFTILQNGKMMTKKDTITFTIDGPYEAGNPIKYSWTIKNTIKLPDLAKAMGNRNSIQVYIYRELNGVETAGPITFVSSNNSSNPEYAMQCAVANKNFSDTSTAWNFKAPQKITVGKTGSKLSVLNNELLNVRILPTSGMLSLLEKLNPELSTSEIIRGGTSIKLPVFKEADKRMQKTIQKQIEEDGSINELENAIFMERSNTYQQLFKIFQELKVDSNVMKPLKDINHLLFMVEKYGKIKFKKYHTEMLNGEIEKFNNYLIKISATNAISTINLKYVHSFSNYISKIIKPYFPEKKSTSYLKVNSSGLMAQSAGTVSIKMKGIYGPASEFDLAIHVFIDKPIPNSNSTETIDSMESYWVYCLVGFQFDNLNEEFIDMRDDKKANLRASELNKLIRVADLDDRTKCKGRASITSRKVDPDDNLHFLVVTSDYKRIVIHNVQKINELAKRTYKDDIPEAYGLGLYEKQ